MPSNLSKYVARSPRYILQPEDNTLIRLAGPNQVPWEEGTEITNMSASGLAFTAPADLCPVVGEIVKVQFDVPGSTAMAAYALVTRVEPKAMRATAAGNTAEDFGRTSGGTMVVATQFVQMDTSQKLHMAQGLGKKLRDATDGDTITISRFDRKKAFTYAGLGLVLLLLWVGLFFIWHQP